MTGVLSVTLLMRGTYGSKSSSAAITYSLSVVNSAWWALPSGHASASVDSYSSGSGSLKSVSPR